MNYIFKMMSFIGAIISIAGIILFIVEVIRVL